MDINKHLGVVTEFIKKYRFVALILAIGIVLMVLPTGKKTENHSAAIKQEAVETESVEQRLTKILTDIDGAGAVRVMLTEASGQQLLYQTDEDKRQSDGETDVGAQTVIITDANKNQSALIRQIIPAQYLGAIVLCQGADSAGVRLAVIDAVSKVTGLRSDHISVVKMK